MNVEFPDFPSDHTANPKLHMFYVKTAAMHLSMVDRMIRKLQNYSNLNTSEFAHALQIIRDKKVKEDAAYRDADDILQMARTGQPVEPQDAAEIEPG